jgi:flagellar biosynthesis protein FlhF
MHLKKYRRPTVQAALRAVREELGPDALVLSTESVSAQGMRGWVGGKEVEVTAATERRQVSETRPSSAAREASLAGREMAARLQAGGMDAALARDVVGSVPSGLRRSATAETVRRALTERMVGLAAADDPYAPIEVFVGPPGAGKTTTIVKIAGQERARHGQRLGLVAADAFRVGAVEQLRMYAEIMGSAFSTARSPRELEQVLEKARKPLLVDTAGRSPKDEASREMFRVLAHHRGVRTHLVMPAATTPSMARRLIERFQDAQLSRVILTKLDEADSIAPLLAIIRDSGLPLSFLGTGQSVPDDLERATPAAIATWVLGEDARMKAVA